MYKKLTNFWYANVSGKKSGAKNNNLAVQNEPPYYNTVNNKITQPPAQAIYSNMNYPVNSNNMYSSNIAETDKSINKNIEYPLYDNIEPFGKTQSPVSSLVKLQKPINYKNDVNDFDDSSSGITLLYKSIKPKNGVQPPNKLSYEYSVNRFVQPITERESKTEVDSKKDFLVNSTFVNNGNKCLDDHACSFDCTKCAKCNKNIMEGFGCIAMDNTYHIKCFTCTRCGDQLKGNPFYLINSKPFCEKDYLDSLEKCSICNTPMINRFVKGSGRNYHPNCFRCVVCFTLLDGIPYTIDTTNQIYCIDDYQKKFAPKCSVCRLPIIQEAGLNETLRIVALDRNFHLQCYRCEDCDTLLGSNADGRGCYPLDGHVLCRSCNAKRIQDLTSIMVTEV